LETINSTNSPRLNGIGPADLAPVSQAIGHSIIVMNHRQAEGDQIMNNEEKTTPTVTPIEDEVEISKEDFSKLSIR
jgi:hypothetical protein